MSELKKYMHEVSSLLECSNKEKEYYLSIIKNDFAYFSFLHNIFNVQLFTKGADTGKVERFQPQGNGNGIKRKILVGELTVEAECMQKQEGILSAGNTDSHTITGFNKIKIMIRLANTAKCFLHE